VQCLLISTPCCHKLMALRWTMAAAEDGELAADPAVSEAIALHVRTCRG
jgi:hypothetical protein